MNAIDEGSTDLEGSEPRGPEGGEPCGLEADMMPVVPMRNVVLFAHISSHPSG